jgi:hypothetical protein
MAGFNGLQFVKRSRAHRREAWAKFLPCLTIAAVDIQRPWFLARCGLVRRSVHRSGCGAPLNATELVALGVAVAALLPVFDDPAP